MSNFGGTSVINACTLISPGSVLAQAIVREGLKNLAAGANPIILKKGIEKAVDCR